jgi:hypothetical protein
VKVALVCVAVVSPVPVTVTLAFAFAVDPPEAYCTVIVQLPAGVGGAVLAFAGLRTVPLAQVPPVMVKPLVAVPVGVTVGAAVNVNAPAVAPVAEFVTVTVPVSVTALAGVGLSAGTGALIANVAPVTVNGTLVVVPPGVVTVMFRAPSAAPDVTLNVAVIVIAFTTVSDPVARLTPPPRPPMVVPVAVKFVPVRVTGTARAGLPPAGWFAEFGLMEVNVGAGGFVTVNGSVLVVPIGVTTPMFLTAVVLAVAEMLIWAATVVPHPVAGPPVGHGSSTVTLPATRVIPPPPPPPPRPLSDVAPVRLVPVNVKLRALLPLVPVAGATPVSVGPSTVKGTVLLVPVPVVMLTFLAPRAAVVEMVKVAVAVCGLVTVKPLMVMPPPETAIPVAPVKLVPVSVTETAG